MTRRATPTPIINTGAAACVLIMKLPRRQQLLMLRQLWRMIPRSKRADVGLELLRPYAPQDVRVDFSSAPRRKARTTSS